MKFDLTFSAIADNDRLEILKTATNFDLATIDALIIEITEFLGRNNNSQIYISHLEMFLIGLGGEVSSKIEVPNLFWNGALKLNEFLYLLGEFQASLNSFSGEDLHLDIAKYIAALTKTESVPQAIRNVDKIILDIVHQPNASRNQAKTYFVKKAMEKIIIEAKEKQLSELAIDTLKTSYALYPFTDVVSFEKRFLNSLVEFDWLEGTDYFYITARTEN